jgi:hypothetical protein
MASLIEQIEHDFNISEDVNVEFSPYAYYGEEEDALTFYFSGERDYAKRINSRVTVFLSEETDELVGCQVKSVRHVLDDIGWFDVSIKHGKVKLSFLFVACRGEFGEEDKLLFREINRHAMETDLEVAVPEMA